MKIPKKWHCSPTAEGWQCQDKNASRAKGARIIVSAHTKSVSDSLDRFKTFLSQPIATEEDGFSQPIGVAKINIHDQDWIDGYHLGSEVSNWYTRYLTTIKDEFAIVVSLSNHSAMNSRYNSLFAQTVASIKIPESPTLEKPHQTLQINEEREAVTPHQSVAEAPISIEAPLTLNQFDKKIDKKIVIALLIVLAVVSIGSYLILRRRPN
jgi:hypothetical protein